MTKRKTPAKTSQNATKQLSESVEDKSNTTVAKKAKASTNTSQKASTGRRGRPKKVVDKSTEVEVVSRLVQKVADVESPIITYVDPMTMAAKQEPEPSLYSRFKDWLVFKLYYYTSFFKGY